MRKLKRVELLEILTEQSREIDRLKKRLKETEKKLHAKEIRIEESGSIAEAALRLNHIFEDAQRAADQYVENVQRRHRRQTEYVEDNEEYREEEYRDEEYEE